jgi:hypothetical protein
MSPNEVRNTFYKLAPVPGGEMPYLQQQNWPVASLAERQAPADAPDASPVEAEAVAP